MILRGDQVVKYGDGSMKTLDDIGAEQVLFPNTQVQVDPDDPTMDLEDYIEDIAESAGGISDWTLLGSAEITVGAQNVKVPNSLLSLFTENNYHEIMIKEHVTAAAGNCSYFYKTVLPSAFVLDEFFYTMASAYTSLAFPQDGAPYGYKFEKISNDIYLRFAGAQWFITNSAKLSLEFYVR